MEVHQGTPGEVLEVDDAVGVLIAAGHEAVDLGTEVDLQLQAKYKRFVGLLKFALYDAYEGRTPAAYQDTTKFWAQLEYVW